MLDYKQIDICSGSIIEQEQYKFLRFIENGEFENAFQIFLSLPNYPLNNFNTSNIDEKSYYLFFEKFQSIYIIPIINTVLKLASYSSFANLFLNSHLDCYINIYIEKSSNETEIINSLNCLFLLYDHAEIIINDIPFPKYFELFQRFDNRNIAHSVFKLCFLYISKITQEEKALNFLSQLLQLDLKLIQYSTETMTIVSHAMKKFKQIGPIIFHSLFLSNIQSYIYQNSNISEDTIKGYLQILSCICQNPIPNSYTYDSNFFFKCAATLTIPLPSSLIILLHNFLIHLKDPIQKNDFITTLKSPQVFQNILSTLIKGKAIQQERIIQLFTKIIQISEPQCALFFLSNTPFHEKVMDFLDSDLPRTIMISLKAIYLVVTKLRYSPTLPELVQIWINDDIFLKLEQLSYNSDVSIRNGAKLVQNSINHIVSFS